MEYVQLGETGLEVSQLCLGTWMFGTESEDGVVATDREQAQDLLDAAWDRGINFFDTANSYGGGDSERYIGDWLDEHDRENFVLASKVYWATRGRRDVGLSRKIIRAEIEDTLDRLGTDYLDLYYIHRWDEATPIEETLATLNDLVREGTVHYLGASTMAAWQLTKALWTSDVNGWEPFKVTQPLLHAGYRDDITDYLDVCIDQELAVCPYSPLAGGFLTGKYERTGEDPTAFEGPDGARGDIYGSFEEYYLSERGWHVLDEIRAIADEADATPAQVALRWLIEQPDFTCVPIVGARTVDQLDENVGAVDVSLSDDQFQRIIDARYAESGTRYGHRW